jgi:hypothetical protein
MVLPSGPWFAAGVSTAPLLPDAAYMGLVLPMPGDMGDGGLVNDDDALPPDVAFIVEQIKFPSCGSIIDKIPLYH